MRDKALKLLGTDFCTKHISNSIPGYRQLLRIWAPFLFFFLMEEILRVLETFYNLMQAKEIVQQAEQNFIPGSVEYIKALDRAREVINTHHVGWISRIK